MDIITKVEELEALYGDPVPLSLDKVVNHLTPLYRQWIEGSRFLVLTTVGPEGVDASPRGDDGPVVQIADNRTLLLPDWKGNNRLDSLKNIVRDGRLSLMFMVPGCDNVVRVMGNAALTADADTLARFDKGGKRPRTVIIIRIQEVYFQCAKALMRSNLWAGVDQSDTVPTAGAFMREQKEGFAADEYDAGYADYGKPLMW